MKQVPERTAGDAWTELILGAALVTMALVAGLNFTFAATVMPNLADSDDHTFVATMQRFNENPGFPLSFTAALALTALAALLQRHHGSREAMRWTVAALGLYAAVLAVTGAIHIPLNQEITEAGDLDRIANLAHVRDDFETPWVAWNIVRTVLCTAALAALALAALRMHRRNASADHALDDALLGAVGAHRAAAEEDQPRIPTTDEALP